MDPLLDFGQLIRQAGLQGVLDRNSIEVRDSATGAVIPHATSDDFNYSDRGRVEWVIGEQTHVEYTIGFATNQRQTEIASRNFVPATGTGDLLRYNASQPRPLTLFYSAGLHDLAGNGRADLVGTWNYAHRPGRPWSGVVCYPRNPQPVSGFEFSDLVRLRWIDRPQASEPEFFEDIYTSSDLADFDGDGRLDLVRTVQGAGQATILLQTKRRDRSGLPLFAEAASVATDGWEACRAVDLNRDGKQDIVVDGLYLKNTAETGWPFEAAAPAKLDAGRQPCFIDLDADGLLDAVCLQGDEPTRYRAAWRRNIGGDPPRFGPQRRLGDINVEFTTYVARVEIEDLHGLLVQHNASQELVLYELVEPSAESPQFALRGRMESRRAVMSLSDQAWPCLCDWDDDGDFDLLVGGGYGWPRIVINEGTRTRPAFAEPQSISADGEPIRFVRNEILGEPDSWHNMGYPYPDFVDWDGDALPDLVFPNETNRIFWYKNIGTQKSPQFAARRQIICDGYRDSPESRARSAQRAAAEDSNNGVYPLEEEQPFFWRTGAAFADWNADGLTDFVTHDGFTRKATLFAQYRDEAGRLRLRKDRELELTDGRPIDDRIVNRRSHWTESFRAVDWDGDGLLDLIYSLSGAHSGIQDDGSIYLLRNAGTQTDPTFEPPRTMRCFGEPIRITNHGPHPWAGDFDGDGRPDLITCVEWSVYPFYNHAALEMPSRPEYEIIEVGR